MRRLPITTHAVVELLAGLALIVCAFAVTASAVGIVTTFAAGVVVAGSGLAASGDMPLDAHRSFDQALIVALALAAVGCAAAGEAVAPLLLLGAGVTLVVLVGATRWTRRPVAG